MRIAVNVMRARLTVIGFNIAIVSFQISLLYRMSGGVNVPGLDHSVHLRAYIALFMALALSLISLVVFIMSCKLDDVGFCDHWSFMAADLLMYLAVAYTVTGFFAPLIESLTLFGNNLPGQATQVLIFQKTLVYTGGVAWFMAIYGGPLVTLLRSPFSRRVNITLGIMYLAVLLVLSWVNFQAFTFEAVYSGKTAGISIHFLSELVQPFVW